MKVVSGLRWSDVKSTPVGGREYIGKVTPESARDVHEENLASYEPDRVVLRGIREFLDENDEAVTALAIGASWCGDCRRNVPALVKIEEELGDPRFMVRVLGGVKTLPLKKRSGGPYVWAVPPSPPEATDPKFDLVKIPVIYLFRKDGALVGRIVENPEHEATLEGEILHHLLSD
ncbi:MAG: TlpA family protein disulfide reductase [Promethearchaeota archaeon]